MSMGIRFTWAIFAPSAAARYHNITGLLAAEGATWKDIVRTTCYLRDIDRDYAAFQRGAHGVFPRAGSRSAAGVHRHPGDSVPARAAGRDRSDRHVHSSRRRRRVTAGEVACRSLACLAGAVCRGPEAPARAARIRRGRRRSRELTARMPMEPRRYAPVFQIHRRPITSTTRRLVGVQRRSARRSHGEACVGSG
jgi:hypothetical protein